MEHLRTGTMFFGAFNLPQHPMHPIGVIFPAFRKNSKASWWITSTFKASKSKCFLANRLTWRQVGMMG
jgi:hypothetical protein